MGARYTYKCQSCGLEGLVCGGDGSGMHFECTTVWCQQCNTLSDATTRARYCTDAVTPPALPCPSCANAPLEQWQVGICAKCTSSMRLDSEPDDNGKYVIKYFCDECDYSTCITTDPSIYDDDMVCQGLLCKHCEDVFIVEYQQPGIRKQYDGYTAFELKCEECDSNKVQRWNRSQPCPACGENVKATDESMEFFD